MTKREAWAPVEKRATDHVPGNRRKNVTLIGAMHLSGPIVMRSMLEGLKKVSFADFICRCLVPKLKKGDVVNLDSLGAHYDSRALQVIEEVGAFYLFYRLTHQI